MHHVPQPLAILHDQRLVESVKATDLLDLRRRTTIGVLFPLLARSVKPTDLDTLAGATLEAASNVAWDDVARL